MNPMRAAVLVLVALLSVPLLGMAQEPPAQTAAEIHVVREGETLTEIARSYLGSAAHWQRIYEANRNVLTDPDRIRPGMELRIPDAEGAPRLAETARPDPGVEVIRGGDREPLADVTGVVLEGELRDTADLPEVVDREDRRELLRTRPFVPQGVPETAEERTVFYGSLQASTSRSPTRPGVVVSGMGESLAVTRSAFASAAWIAREADDPVAIGQVEAFAGDQDLRVARTAIQLYDDLEISLDDPSSVSPGDVLVAFHRVGHVEGFGDVKAPSGVLEVRRIEGSGAIARVQNAFDRFELGHSLTRPRTFPLTVGVHPAATEIELGGTLVGFRDRKEIYLPGDQAFLDLGRDDGVAVGDEFAGIAGRDGGWTGEQVARFQVIRVEEDYSTARILTSQSPTAVRTGLRVVLDRKMP
jgi:hypothetical protein